MTEGLVRIYLSYKEPEDKNLLWMRPYLDKEGYELLYFGAEGWTRWVPCCPDNKISPPVEDCKEEINEIERPCGCL